MKVAVFQHCNQHGRNRLVDRVTINHQEGYTWVKKAYSWIDENKWFFAHNADGSYPINFEPSEFGFGMFYMIGKDSEDKCDVIILIEERNLHGTV